MSDEDDWAEAIVRRLRAKNVWTHPHHWRYDAIRDAYLGVDSALGSVAGMTVDLARSVSPLRVEKKEAGRG